jgi:hypothetical protein
MDVSAHRDRIPAGLLVLWLHALALALLLYSFQRQARPQGGARETVLLLPRLARPSAAPAVIDARGRPRRAQPVLAPPPVVAPGPALPRNAPSTAPAPDIQGLGRSLFGCAPETYADLPAEQRARCPKPGGGLAARQAPDLMGGRSHVKDEAHWQEEWARERSPTVLPCMGGVDVLCLLRKIADGSLAEMADPRTWPRYEVKQIPPEDFKKLEDAYAAWHKAHPRGRPAPAQ